MRRLSSFSLWIALAIAAPALHATPSLVLGDQSLRAEGLTAAGRAVVFTIGKPVGGLMPATARFEAVLEVDAGGAASLDLPSPVAERSVWAVVDLQSGELAVAAPGQAAPRLVAFPARGVGQTRKFLRDHRRFLEVLLVRPAAAVPAGGDVAAESGAWGQSFGDGGESDGDGELDGKIDALLAELRPIGDSPALPPDEVKPGDVVVAIDPMTLEIYTAKLAL